MKTKGELITGRKAQWYNLRLPIWQYIRQGHLRNIELQPGQCLLDVGCGTGITLAALNRKYGDSVELYDIEPSEDMVSQAEGLLRNSTYVRLKTGTAEKLPYKDSFFDYVTCSLVMHHMPKDVKLESLKEIRRVLKPGGVLVLTDWEKPTNPLGRFIGWLWRNHAYVRENTGGILAQLLKKAGFKESRIETASVQAGIVHHFKVVR